jgi:phage N-6-adenine-methyltransferase
MTGASPITRRTKLTGKEGWYTPATYIEAVCSVMDGIDLDPASSEGAQRTVRAAQFFTAENDGLGHLWHGRVFLNPPYKAPKPLKFITKLVNEYQSWKVTEAILLVNSATETKWFQKAASACSAFCQPSKRIAFFDPENPNKKPSPTQGSTVFYFGWRPDRFEDVFLQFGLVFRARSVTLRMIA